MMMPTYRDEMHVELQDPCPHVELISHREPLVVGLELVLGSLHVGIRGQDRGVP